MNFVKSIKNLSNFEKCLWIGSLLILIISFLLIRSSNWLTIIASLIGATALIFVAKGDAIGQLLTVVFSILYAIISFQFRYYGEMITYIGMSAPIAFISMISWLKHPYTEREVKVNHLKKKSWLLLFLSTLLVTWGFYYVLKAGNTPNMLFSTISVSTSFLAASLMMLRSPYYAVAYAANDVILIILWILATIEDIVYLPMIVCFIIFFINDLYGFLNWTSMKKKQAKNSSY